MNNESKVLIFSHKPDIDGAGGIVLAKLAFADVTYELSETFEINNKVQKYIDDKSIYNYSDIYITDLCIKEPLLSYIDKDAILKSKIKVFDHHKYGIEEGYNKYDFVNVTIKDDKGKCSGTSLFYNYLVLGGLIENKSAISEFVENTRQYDTWEWKTKYNNEKARELTILFDLIYPDSYINKMYLKLKDNISEFTAEEQNLINVEKSKIEKYVDKAIKNIITKNTAGVKWGIVYAELYRNDIAETIRSRGIDLDFIAIPKMYDRTISYRQINLDFDVSNIAKVYGGNGHKEAASSPINIKQVESIINKMFGFKMLINLFKLKRNKK